VIKTCYNNQKLCKRAQKISAAAPLRVMASRYNPCDTIFGDLRRECLHQRVVRNTIFRKSPSSVVSGYGKRSINLNKVVATFAVITLASKRAFRVLLLELILYGTFFCTINVLCCTVLPQMM
jgi:hypothetical protein